MVSLLPERRRHPRTSHPDLPIAMIYPSKGKAGKGRGRYGPDLRFVNIVNSSPNGLLLSSNFPFKANSRFMMNLSVPDGSPWRNEVCKVLEVEKEEDPSRQFRVRVEFLRPEEREGRRSFSDRTPGPWIDPADLEFLLGTPLLDSISQEARCALLSCLKKESVPAGERLMSQGEQGDSLFIIRRGSCVVSVEQDSVTTLVSRLQSGDIVGEMAILTGEPRLAHVDAETDMDLWGITRKDFDRICEAHQELRNFLTRLITRRFSSGGMSFHRSVGKYVINEMIGKGGWSLVYRGIHANLNMPVAVKMLKHDLAMNPRFLERFREEAKTIARLNHENIVKVYDIEELFRTIFVVMEYLEGVSLAQVLRKMVRLPIPKALTLLLDVCSGLAYAHSQGIVHQDIKPANIFVMPDDKAKIMDFGLACAPGEAHSALTGSFYYMSPEQIIGEAVDPRADIYSLGLTAYEMITGHHPFPKGNVADAVCVQFEKEIPDPKTLVPDLPGELREFLLRATKRDPARRYPSVDAALDDLRPLAERLGAQEGEGGKERRKMMSLFLFYHDEQQLILNRLVEQFGAELKRLGAVLRVADFKDL